MGGAGNGVRSLISEYIVNRIASAAGLPVPDAFIVEIPNDFPWEFGTDEFYDLVLKSRGPNLGLAWIEGAEPVPAGDYNHLPQDLVSQVVTLDLTFSNVDRPATNGNLLRDRRGRHWIVDHGSCCFLFPSQSPSTRLLPAGHAFSGWEAAFDPRWLQGSSPATIETTADELPQAWLTQVGTDRIRVREQTLLACGVTGIA